MAIQQAGQEHLTTLTAQWELTVLGHSSTQDASFVINHTKPEVLVATGFGETDISQVAERLGHLGIRAAVFNLAYPQTVGGEDLKLTPAIMEQTVLKSVSAIAQEINMFMGYDAQTPMSMVGHSKGFGELLKFVSAYPEACDNLAGAAPLGANCIPKIMGSTPKEYRANFKTRLRESGLLSSLVSHPEAGRLGNEFMAGIQYLHQEDAPALIRNLHGMGILKSIVIGSDDALCPPAECEQAIGIAGLIVTTAGKHDHISTPEGMAQIALAIEQCINLETR
ncbi:MAG TPA: hypothetical protein VN778_00355 [Verrucomicrobiae bacterium]|nr:hypothetical protein [Verrucomicrobiae bacterium]